MRTNIDIDDELMTQAMQATGHTTKKATVETALREIVLNAQRRQALKDLWGSVPDWEGDLDAMRRGDRPDQGLYEDKPK